MITYLLLLFAAFLNVLSYYISYKVRGEIAQEVKDTQNFNNRIKQMKILIIPKGTYKKRAANEAMKEFVRENQETPVQNTVNALP